MIESFLRKEGKKERYMQRPRRIKEDMRKRITNQCVFYINKLGEREREKRGEEGGGDKTTSRPFS
jgi:hypothetical protein